jgi:uncharacterized phiE125 gp8 family phage protein
MPLQRLIEPTIEPLTLAEAKAQCKVEFNDDDDLITALISAARDFAENRIERSLCTQTWQLTLDAFPGPSLTGVPFGKGYSIPKHAILLERPPVLSITSIQYLDMSNVLQTMPSTDWVDATLGGTQRVDDLVRVTPVFGKIWPIPMPQINSVRVTYVAGYGAAAAVPAGIKSWLKLRLAALYENREEVVVGTRVTVQELPYIDNLLNPWTVRMCS